MSSAVLEVVGDGTTAGSRASRRWRAARPWLLVGAVVLLSAVVAALAVPRSDAGRLDPRSPAPAGARAVAQVLEDRGVGVRLVRDLDEAVAGATAGSTLLVARSELLTPTQLERLAGTAADLVLVEPDATALRELAPVVETAGTAPAEVVPPSCGDVDAVAADEALGGGLLYVRAGTDAGATCYRSDPQGDAGSYVALPAGGAGVDRRTVVLGQGDLLTNRDVADAGNAALALRALGQQDELVWYLARPEREAVADGPTAADLLPDAARWVPLQLLVVLVVVVLWRARRLGRLVPEPLPVVVRAAETTEGRARLYARASGPHGGRARAAATLRTAALRRLADRLGTGRTAAPEQVAAVAATASARPGAEVAALLLGPPPTDDAGLVRLADDLDALEREVREGA